MRGVGESTYYTKLLRPQLEEVLNDSDYEMEHILGKRKLVVHTDRISDELSDSIGTLLESDAPKNIKVERYNHNIEVSWWNIDKYAKCTDIFELYAVDPDKHGTATTLGTTRWYTLDLTSDGNFIYPLPKLEKLDVSWGSSYFQKVSIDVFKISLPLLTGNNDKLFSACHQVKTIECDLPLVTGFGASFCQQLRRFVGNTPNVTNWNEAFVSVGWKHNDSLDIDCDFSKANTATNMANSCKLNKASVLRICVGEKSIPAHTSGTHDITLGIHVDHQTDEEVLAAITEAENKRWTLTVQWNGKPTAQTSATYGLRKQPIYAKIDEMELPDGTTERVLCWGHYVTNSEDYQEFSSLEEAREYFGISEEI